MDMYKADILIVDDNPDNLAVLAASLQGWGYKTRPVMNGPMALKAAKAAPPDLILLDINMPGMNGYQVCRELKADPELAEIPVIFVSALGETLDKVEAFRVGGVDYITKPIDYQETQARVHTHVTLYQQRRELERRREQELRYYQKLSETKDQFVNIVSHDLKSPLSNIKLSVEMLRLLDLVSDERGLRYLNNIERGLAVMQTLVTDLLDLAKIESGVGLERAPIRLEALLQSTVIDFEVQAAEKSIALSFENHAGKISALVDLGRMQQVLNNLLSNAIKYTPEYGQIVLSLSLGEANRLIISVRDNGIGIPHEALPHLFEKFFRVKREDHQTKEGSGLGLAICRTIVEQHGGMIWAESRHEGSTFYIALPALPPELYAIAHSTVPVAS